jgi:hypothetical protein
MLGKILVTTSVVLALGFIGCGGGGGGGDDLPPGTQPPGGNGNPPPAGGSVPLSDVIIWTGNTVLERAAPGVLGNDPVGATVADPGERATTAGGTATVNADGSFTYRPAVGAQGVTDTFTYRISADGSPATVSVTLRERVWYVDNSLAAAGNGTKEAPFTTLAAAVGESDTGDTIYVFRGTGTDQGQDAGVSLGSGRRLLGQGVPLVVEGVTVVLAAAEPPVLSNRTVAVGNVPVVTLTQGSTEVAGFRLEGVAGQTNQGILGSGAFILGFNIHDNTFAGFNREPIMLEQVGGVGTVANNRVTATGAAANGANAIDIRTSTSGVNFTITGNTVEEAAGTGIRVILRGTGNLQITSNVIPRVGLVEPQSRGIDVDAEGAAANITTFVQGNTVGSAAGPAIGRAAIQVNATGGAMHHAVVTDNVTSNASPTEGGINVQTSVSQFSRLCLRMERNTTDGSIVLDNSVNSTSFELEGPTQALFLAANPGVTTLPSGFPPTHFFFVGTGVCTEPTHGH